MIYCTALSHLTLDGPPPPPCMQVLLYCAEIGYKKTKSKKSQQTLAEAYG